MVYEILKKIFWRAILLLCATTTYAQVGLPQLKTELISAWLVTLEGEDRTRTLKILDVEQMDAGTFPLVAVYGWTDGNQSSIKAEIAQAGQERTLLLTTQPGSKIKATQAPDGAFVGTFIFPDGTRTKTVRLERASPDQLRAKVDSFLKGFEITKPAADVPLQCAAFSGRWTGTWRADWGNGDTDWLSVIEVNAKCVARLALRSDPRPPTRLTTSEIRNGELSIPCDKGTCAFQVHGDEIWGSYSGSNGKFQVVLKKTQ